MKPHPRRRVLEFGALALLGACSTPAPTVAPGVWAGKLAYQMEAGAQQRAQAGSALFEWQGTAEQGQLSLSTPLGTTLATARWSEQGVWLDDGQGPRRYATLEELGEALGQALQGPPLPLRPLVHWFQGRPAPDLPVMALEDGFEQAGWRVQRTAPQRLTLSRAAQGGQGALRLVLIWSE